MSVRVWFEEDIRNALAASARVINMIPLADSPEQKAYAQGYRAAISMLCTSFGMQFSQLGLLDRTAESVGEQPLEVRFLLPESAD